MNRSDERKGGGWGDHTRAGQPWDDDEDNKLIVWGRAIGYDFVAGHDFGREPREGTERIEWLRANKPKMVAHIEAEQDRFNVMTEPLDMRRKENRIRRH